MMIMTIALHWAAKLGSSDIVKLVAGTQKLDPDTRSRYRHACVVYVLVLSSARARRACALRTLGLLLADDAPTVGRGKTF